MFMGVSVSIFNGNQYGKLVSAQYIWNPEDDTPGPRARDAISPPVTVNHPNTDGATC